MIREVHRNNILERLKIMRRHETLHKKSKQNFIDALRAAHEDPRHASHQELADLVGLSRQRITQLLEEKEDS